MSNIFIKGVISLKALTTATQVYFGETSYMGYDCPSSRAFWLKAKAKVVPLLSTLLQHPQDDPPQAQKPRLLQLGKDEGL